MKSLADDLVLLLLRSLPVRGAWIEMPRPSLLHKKRAVSLPVRGAWIEMASPLRRG